MLIVKKRSEIPPLTSKDRKELRDASRRPITYDDDCPQTTDAEFVDFISKHIGKSFKLSP